MSEIAKQRWVSYAGSDKEAWKCILLARALRRTLTRRPLLVIISDNVERNLGLCLQEEVSQLVWVDPGKYQTGLPFGCVAKLKAEEFKNINKSVFIDCNALPLKNCDELFNLNGARWVDTFAGIFIKPRSLGQAGQQLITDVVVNKESGGVYKGVDCFDGILIKEFDFGMEIDANGIHPIPLDGKNTKMVFFTDGHYLDKDDVATFGPLETEVMKLCVTLCPEKYERLSPGSQELSVEIPCELNDSIAIIGMACRYPCANNIDEFWTLLEQGLEGIRKVPQNRWTKANAFIRMDNMRGTDAGFLSCPVDTFDAKFFNINAADMAYLDPQQRLALRIVWEALEHALIDPNSLKGSPTGVFGGWWRNDYKEMLQMLGVVDSDFLRGYMGNAIGPFTARISHFLELIGPSFSTESGCSTSIVGVDMACESLKKEACNLAIAVAANLLLHPFSPSLMESVLAPDGRCKTFDASADGFGRAEGIGVLILKRFSDAVADGDRIWGVVRGSAVVQEGPSKSMGTPTVDVEAKAMQLALERSGIDPNDVDYLETHGTGTPVGDPIEIAAVAKAYGQSLRGNKVLTIGSVKTNIGHTESVCGIASIQKTVLCMKHELIPKHLQLTKLNPEINLASIPACIPLEPIPWKRGNKPRIAGVNSFGITGAQAHFLIQEPPEPKALRQFKLPMVDSRKMRVLTFSAKTDHAFKAQVKAYTAVLEEAKNDEELKDIEYTMHTGRPHFNFRGTVIGSTGEGLLNSLEQLKCKQIPYSASKICFVFPGQGCHYHGMAKYLNEQNIVFRTHFDWCDSILTKEHGVSIRPAIWEENQADLLKQSLYSQISIFVIEYCLLRLWESWGVQPDAVLGHSLGEFVAAIAAGMIKPKDALNLVVARSKLINALPSSSMIVVGTDLLTTQELMGKALSGEWLDVAAINSSSQIVLAGSTDKVHEFKNYCKNNGIKTHVLESSHAFHSSMMDPMLKDYEAAVSKIKFNGTNSNVTFISAVDGKVMSKVDTNYWVRHTRDAVRFVDASTCAVKNGFTLFLEVGPHPILSPLIVSNVDDIADVNCIHSLRRKTDDWTSILTSLSQLYCLGVPINWENFHRYSGANKVDLPGYHFEETPHWMAIKDDGSTPFHPLLGGFVPNPSAIKIFKNSLNVNRVPFLKDHALGDKIIFPCAGYVDLCITAAYASCHSSQGSYIKPGGGPLSIREFSIATPVCLNETQATEFQVVVSKTEDGEICSTVYTKLYLEDINDNDGPVHFKWVRNASATFSSHPVGGDFTALDLSKIQERCTEVLPSHFDYDDLVDYGFNFGPSLRVLRESRKCNVNGVDEFLFRFETKESAEDHEKFILHPWTIDPMLQAQIFCGKVMDKGNNRKRLVVPVSIDTFVWWGGQAHKGYIYVKDNAQSGLEAHLFSESGKLVASMIGTEFMETTLSNILSLIEAQRSPYPAMSEIVWKERLGSEERRIPEEELGSIALKEIYSVTLNPALNQYNHFTPEEAEFFNDGNKLASLFMLKAIKELDVEAYLQFSWTEVAEKVGVVPELRKFFRFIMTELVKDGWFSMTPDGTFFIPKKPLPHDVQGDIDQLQEDMRSKKIGLVDLSVVETIWGVLSKLLTRKRDALLLLYPENDFGSPGPAELYYTQSLFAEKRFALNKIEGGILSTLAKIGNKSVVRVLEVGAGVGSATKYLIGNMTEAGPSHFEYTYTDISPTFLQRGKQLFEESGISAKFEILNVEEDPRTQGFVPGHYDVIMASWVLHATKSIAGSILNLRKLLRPGGYMLITELVEPSRPINLLFGGLDGFWRFEDLELRPWNCELSIEGWRRTLETCGFEDVVGIPSYAGKNALILARSSKETATSPVEMSSSSAWIVFAGESRISEELLKRMNKHLHSQLIIISRTEVQGSDMENKIADILNKAMSSTDLQGIIYTWSLDEGEEPRVICEPFLYICNFVCKLHTSIKIVALTKGQMSTGPSDYSVAPPHSSPIVGMVNVLANENPDLICKCVDVDNEHDSTSAAAVFSELFPADPDVAIAYRNRQRFLPRLKPYKIKSTPLPIPITPRYKLLLPASHLIQDLKFIPCEAEPVGSGEVEIDVKAYALNFLDVFMVTKPDPVFDKYNYVGVDIAGVITAVGPDVIDRKVGDRVVVVRRKGEAMPSHIISSYKRTLHIPEDMTFAEAATYPMGILTVASCLLNAAKAKAGDVVLIHTASGGVGLFAIQIARQFKCEVVVTAGNERKRNYLKGLGLKHVFNSRTTEYEHEIRKALGGRGVDIVLNSLTGEGFKEATLSVCEKGARFIEMSKMNIWTEEDVRKLRPDVYYEVVDVSAVPEDVVQDLTDYLEKQLMAHIEERPRPLPFTRFDASEIREALEYMEKVKHIGKIVLIMPEQIKGAEPKFNLFNERSTYLITGGLGGIGLEVMKWMVSSGARTFLLLSRGGPSNIKLDTSEKIEKLKSLGCRIEICACDVGDGLQLEALIKQKLQSLPPLRGIMHAAGLLDDALYENQTWEKYERVFQSKVKGAWNLHKLSLGLIHPLEHFLVFSSMTGPLGSPGQSNYASGNYYLDQLIHYRNSLGLPGTTINWGQWGQVGMATEFVLHMHKPLTVQQGIASLERIMTSHKTQLIVSDSDYASLKQVLNSTKGLLSDYEKDTTQGQNEIDGDEFWKEYDSASGREHKYEVARKFLKRLIKITLKLDRNEEIDDHVYFQDMGMDSLMMVEMKNGLQASVGKRVKISINAVKDCKTVAQLTERLVELISGKEELPAPTDEELRDLVVRDSKLPEEIQVSSKLLSALKPLQQLGVVLVIGATGTLGPYILRELLCQRNRHIRKVYCLMKPNPLILPLERFKKIYEKKGLLSDIDLNKIECIAGDIKNKHFGMTESAYAQLSSEVELVINLAVKVSFDEVYRETDDPSSTRVINVFGMKNILSFAVERKLKYILHTSSFAAATQVDQEGILKEDWPKEEEALLFPQSAYSISKLICDCLVREAVKKGVPCKVFRLPQIGGDSIKGGNIQMDSFLMTRVLAYMYTGFMHGSSIPLSLMAVDQCAKLCVELFFKEEAGYELFNVLNPYLGDERDFESLAQEFGIPLKVLEADDFIQKWKQTDSSDEMVQLVKFAMTKDAELLGLRDKALPFYVSWREGNKKVFWSRKLERLIPDSYPQDILGSWDVLRRDLIYARNSGVFERYKIKYNNNKQ